MHTFITNKLKKDLSFCLFQFNCYDFFSLEGRPVSGVVRKFKCPLKKNAAFLPRQQRFKLDRHGVSTEVLECPCEYSSTFRPARMARGKIPHSTRLCRLSIYTDTLGVHAWSVRAKTMEKTVCVNGAFVKHNNVEFTNVSSFTSLLMYSTHFTLSCRILLLSLLTTNTFFQVCVF